MKYNLHAIVLSSVLAATTLYLWGGSIYYIMKDRTPELQAQVERVSGLEQVTRLDGHSSEIEKRLARKELDELYKDPVLINEINSGSEAIYNLQLGLILGCCTGASAAFIKHPNSKRKA